MWGRKPGSRGLKAGGHAPENLTLKLLCARAGVNPRDVQCGYADLAKLRTAAAAWAPVAQRLAVVEGSSQLTVAQVRAQARRATQGGLPPGGRPPAPGSCCPVRSIARPP